MLAASREPLADVIVVGAGSAGAAAARRLVDAGARVLLLEAGDPDTNPAIHDPARAHELWFAPEDWGAHTVPQPHAAGRRLHWPRGKVLGGSSALNGMIWARGVPADYDHWAYLGNFGWSWRDVLPVYERIEDFDRGASDGHGSGGPLRILTDCVGVEWEHLDRAEHAHAAEVIVCAGTIESPRLLMLSGIGPAEHLADVGIEVAQDLPGVGVNLHDHLLSPVIFTAEREIEAPAPGLPPAQSHLFAHSRPGLLVPDLQPIHFSVPLYEDWMQGPANAFSLMAGMIRPVSRGQIRLAGADPRQELLIDPGTLSCEADLRGLQAAVALCRTIGAGAALREWGARELYPGPGVDSPERLLDYVRRTAITYHHQVGTCKMGVDRLAVVDPELRVHGMLGLRVADASIMPDVTTGNTNAPSVMIGERVAEFVSAGRAASPVHAVSPA